MLRLMWCACCCGCYQCCQKMDNCLFEIDNFCLTSGSLTTNISVYIKPLHDDFWQCRPILLLFLGTKVLFLQKCTWSREHNRLSIRYKYISNIYKILQKACKGTICASVFHLSLLHCISNTWCWSNKPEGWTFNSEMNAYNLDPITNSPLYEIFYL